MANEPGSGRADQGTDINQNANSRQSAANASGFYAARPSLERGLESAAHPARPFQPLDFPHPNFHSAPGSAVSDTPEAPTTAAKPVAKPAKHFRWPWQQVPTPIQISRQPGIGNTGRTNTVYPTAEPAEGGTLPVGPVGPVVKPPRWWEKQPYLTLLYVSALGGTLTAAWLLGILIAQLTPPRSFERPPLQESVLRRSSRLVSNLWHLPQLWDTPTEQTQIRAIPLPDTGPVLDPVALAPIERQPLVDELNSIETEILTLDRRLQSLEKRLGRPPYQGADIDSRVKALRVAIDPPVRPEAKPTYEPVPTDPSESLLEVARLKITLPSDALFTPGETQIKDAALLNSVLDQLVNYPGATILIRCYGDDQVDAIASRKYTLAQANALKVYLQASLPGTYRWVSIGGGRSQPIADNKDVLGRQSNRRIEILVDTRS
ncbi:MAG: hypothetical protein WA885_21470 [Phormidesmis sp.]